jgi:O-antigen/teichoic acid export membrane protein
VLVIARALDPSGRGAIAFVTTASLLVGRVAKLGFPDAATLLAARRPADRRGLVTTLLTFSLTVPTLLAALTVVVVLTVPGAQPSGVTDTAVLAIGVAIVGSGVADIFLGFLLGCQRYRAVPLVAASSWLYAGLVSAAAVLGRLDVTVAAGSFAFSTVFGGVLLFAAATRGALPSRPDTDLAREALHYGVRAWPGSMAAAVNFRLDQILVAYMAGETALGIYATAVNVSELLLYLPNAAAVALTPATAAASRSVQVAATLRAFRVVMVLTGVIAVPAAVLGPVLIPLVFGAPFEPSVMPFLFLLVGTFGWAGVSVFSGGLLAAATPGRSAIGLVTSLVTGLLLDLALIPPFGATGAAVAASAAFFAGAVATIATYRHLTRFRLTALVPRRDDVVTLWQLIGRVRRRLGSAAAT